VPPPARATWGFLHLFKRGAANQPREHGTAAASAARLGAPRGREAALSPMRSPPSYPHHVEFGRSRQIRSRPCR
jgi:hypothetical protein